MIEIRRQRTQNPEAKPKTEGLGFGRFLTDHVFIADHTAETGWTNARIVPKATENVDVASGCVQYGLSIFEGLKAHRTTSGELRLFRPDAHARRFVDGSKRLCMPAVDPELFLAAVKALVQEDADWYPEIAGGALYVRPTLLATESFLGVRPSQKHMFNVMLSPVAHYYAKGENPLRLWAEKELVRAAPGGTGAVKTGGNYASSLLAAQRAQARGFDQVLWLDSHERRWLEEVGTMNLWVRIGDTAITPPLDGTILGGITRNSLLQVLREWGFKAEERRISLDEIAEADKRGDLLEIFGSGTAAVVSPVGELTWDGGTVKPKGGDLAKRLRKELEDLFAGRADDKRGWMMPVKG